MFLRIALGNLLTHSGIIRMPRKLDKIEQSSFVLFCHKNL